jgi:phosphate transport system substrate-binding protein
MGTLIKLKFHSNLMRFPMKAEMGSAWHRRFWQPWVGAIALGLLTSCTSASNDAATEEALIQVGGSAEALEVLEDLAEAYEDSVEGVEISFLPPSQSSSGIQGVKDDLLDMGAVSSTPAPSELGVLQYVPLVQTPLVFVVHETVTGIDDLTQPQVQGIYDGSITNWQVLGGPDADIILLDFTEDENEKEILRQVVLGEDLAITDQAIVFPEDDEILETAIITPYSIAAIPLEDDVQEASLQILSLDGVAPTPENMQSGTYGMSLALGLVLAESPPPAVQGFMDFIASPEGQAILLASTELAEEDE